MVNMEDDPDDSSYLALITQVVQVLSGLAMLNVRVSARVLMTS